MAAIILIPAVVCWAVMAMGSARKALLYVYLPALLLVPQYYVFRLPHLPPLSFADAAILPLGIALAVTGMRRWRLAWMDLWVLLFAVCAGLSEALSTELANGDWMRLLLARICAVEKNQHQPGYGGLMFVARCFDDGPALHARQAAHRAGRWRSALDAQESWLGVMAAAAGHRRRIQRLRLPDRQKRMAKGGNPSRSRARMRTGPRRCAGDSGALQALTATPFWRE